MNIKHRKVIETEARVEFKSKLVKIDMFNNGKKTETILASSKDFLSAMDKAKTNASRLNAISKLKRYYYYTSSDMEKIFKGVGYEWFLNSIHDIKFRDISKVWSKLEEGKVFYFDNSSNLFYPIDSDNPLSNPYRMDYISGGITDGEYDLDKVEKILKGNKWVSNVRRIDIPYYNCEEGISKAVEYTVHLPQKLFDKIVKECRSNCSESYWSAYIKDYLTYRSWIDFDYLKLKSALLSKQSKKAK